MPQSRTRSKVPFTAPQDCPVPQLRQIDNKLHSLFILPENLSPEARFVSLRNPAIFPVDYPKLAPDGRYIFCPTTGIHEITRVTAPRTTPHSCLIAHDHYATTSNGDVLRRDLQCTRTEKEPKDRQEENEIEDGYVMEDADIFIATPLDPLFLLAPIFDSGKTKSRFVQSSFFLECLEATADHFSMLLQDDVFEKTISQRLVSICQARNVPGNELVYFPDPRKTVDELLRKVKRMTGAVWPASLDEAFVRKQLEVPVVPTKRESQDVALADDELQLFTIDEDNAIAISSSEDKLGASCNIPSEIVDLMRERTALEYLHESYYTPAMAISFNEYLRERFLPLEEHLERVRKAKADVQALRALSDNISRKRSAVDDDEAAEARMEKKRKKEEEEKKKKAESRAIKALKKVDTSGMKSIGSFFTKTGR